MDDINWDDFNWDKFKDDMDGMWNSSHTGNYYNSDNYFEGFESIRSWLIKEKEKSGLNNKKLRELTTSTHTHYWSKSQWVFPTKEHYNTIKQASNGRAFNKEYEELKKEYEELKKE